MLPSSCMANFVESLQGTRGFNFSSDSRPTADHTAVAYEPFTLYWKIFPEEVTKSSLYIQALYLTAVHIGVKGSRELQASFLISLGNMKVQADKRETH
ncbi:hypothetical protein Mapa_015290 [Marchantia paleacea]|nr:hypothetical protein Mapa_015290 [Marchantia paleacea]